MVSSSQPTMLIRQGEHYVSINVVTKRAISSGGGVYSHDRTALYFLYGK